MQLTPSQVSAFTGSLEAPLVECNRNLGNTSCFSCCHYPRISCFSGCPLYTWIARESIWHQTDSIHRGPHVCSESFAWASTRIVGPSQCSCFFTFSIVSCSPDFSGRHQESRIQPTVPSSPHAERRGEIHPNPSSGGMACGTPGIKNPPHETHSF